MVACLTTACSGPTHCQDCQWYVVSEEQFLTHHTAKASMVDMIRAGFLTALEDPRPLSSRDRGCTTWTPKDRGVLLRLVLAPRSNTVAQSRCLDRET